MNDAFRSYGDTNPAFSGTVTGVADGDMLTATYSSAAGPASSIGTYGITASLSGPDETLNNYIVTVFPGTLTVTPAVRHRDGELSVEGLRPGKPRVDGDV